MLFSQDFYNIKSSRTHHSNLYISSAEMDGATGLKKTWYITLPLIADVLVTCTTLAITGAIKVFNLPSVIAKNGAPKGLTHFLGTYMYS